MRRDQKTKGLARALRRAMTPAEAILWRHLRGKRFGEFKFRRQHPAEPYILDFACIELSFAIEVDGETHLGKEEHDAKRTEFLNKCGWDIIRFWNTEVYDDTEPVLEKIWMECQGRLAKKGSQSVQT